jgi:uracil-DNA glycosylase
MATNSLPDKSLTAEFASLVESTRTHLQFLQELGVERVETLPSPASVPPAASEKETPKIVPPSTLPVHQVSIAAAPRTQRAPAPDVSSTTLFGDMTATEALPPSHETFADIWADIGDCTRCSLHEGRTNIVHTEGDQKARLMFIGEAPGADEDAQARPFVGRAGQLLTKIIEAIGFRREDVLIGNINRCRPPANRAPMPDEVAMCKPFLLREIASVKPEVIVVMGNTAMRNLLDTKEGITRLRGQFQDYKGIKVMPTFHPAYLLRDPSKKRETWEDLKKVRDYLDSTAPSRA